MPRAFRAPEEEGDAVTAYSATISNFTEFPPFATCYLVAGTLIQIYAYLQGADQSNAAIFSIIVSVFTASFTSAGMSFDWDVDKRQQERSPDFYGYLPNGAKNKVRMFLLLFVMAATQLFTKAFAFALCATSNTWLLIGFSVGELSLYLLYKIVTRDFLYWPTIYGPIGIFVAFLSRIGVKIVCDFTAVVQLRHPQEIGGAYWVFNMFLTPITCFYFASRYLNSNEVSERDMDAEADGGQSVNLTATQVYGMIGALCALQVCTFVVFLKSIERKYRRTFFTFETGNTCQEESFLKSTKEAIKIYIFTLNRHKWKLIEPQVKSWLNDRLPIWLQTEPEWFSAAVKASIPDDMVSDPAILAPIRGKEVVAIVEKRRASVVPGLDLGVGSRDAAPDDASLDPALRRRKSVVREAREALRDT